MTLAWLPLLVYAAGVVEAPAQAQADLVTSGRVAQARLAETLAAADAIESIAVSREAPPCLVAECPPARAQIVTVTFSVVRAGEQLRIAATTGRSGEVVSVAIETAGPSDTARHGLTWLAAELADVRAVVRLTPAERGGVMLSTSDGRRYLIGPPRGPRTGNEAVEARWGAAWSGTGT